jgi:type IV secretion system protein VirB3
MTANGHDREPLFLGLTRPALVHGVPMEFFGINFILFGIGMILSESLLAKLGFCVLVCLPLHFIGVLLTQKEPHWMSILLTKFGKCAPNRNRNFWKCQSYSP